LDVAALALSVERVEGERGLARARDARQDDELLLRDADVDGAEVVLPRPADQDVIELHGEARRYPIPAPLAGPRRRRARPRRAGAGAGGRVSRPLGALPRKQRRRRPSPVAPRARALAEQIGGSFDAAKGDLAEIRRTLDEGARLGPRPEVASVEDREIP